MRRLPNLPRPIPGLVVRVLVVVLLAAGGAWFNVAAAPLAATSPTLGASGSYSVLGGETVTNTGLTTVEGDLGVVPGSAITGFPPGIVGPPGVIHDGDQSAADAQADNTAAFIFLDQPCTTTYPTGIQDLVGENLVPGVYCADAFSLSGTLTLSGTVGVWIFKSSADFNTTATANVVGGDPCNVWWRLVSSATLGTNTSLIGNILADTSISLQTGAILNGRAFARTGQVSMDGNTITTTTCLQQPVATSTPTNTPVPPPADTAVPAPTNTPAPVATTVPAVVGLPATGGAPLQREGLPWVVVLVGGGLGALALGLSVRAYRRGR